MEEIKARLAEITELQDKLLGDDDNRPLTEDERKEFDSLSKEYEEKTAELAALKADEKRRDDAAKRRAELRKNGERQTKPESLAVKGEGFENDPKCGFSDHREMFLAVMETGQTGRLADPRLKYLAVGSDEGSTVHDPYGGFLVPTAFSPNLLSVGVETDPTLGRTTEIPMGSPTVELPARVDKNHTSSVSGGLQVYRRNETDTSSATRMEFEQVKLTATMLFGLAYVTEELLERSPMSYIALLEAGFRDEFAAKMLKEKLFGTGAGQMEGVVNAPATVSQGAEVGQAATTLVYENVIKMRARCWGYASAIWLANHDTLPQLMLLNQSVGTGGVPVWQPSAREDHPDTLLGRPLFFSEYCETLGTVGDVILANWTQYLTGTLSGPRNAESMHVRFINHERTFKFYLENDGRCWWRSALTPNQSSTTLSPFVTLAAR